MRVRFSATMARRLARWPGGVLFARFVGVGLLNTAFGYGVFAALVLAGGWPGAALVVATVAGVAFNFQTTRRLVFRTDGRGRVVRFVLVYVAILAINWAALRITRRFGVPDIAAQAALALPMSIAAFLSQKAFVFNSPGEHA